MLQDIPNPFPQVVTRNPRSSHPAGRHPGDGVNTGVIIIPVGTPSHHVDPAEPPVAGQHPDGDPIASRITPEPGPGEVSPPKWWNNKPSNHS